ncbi:hypothetical protein BC827DRAFT_1217085, partial [Russula dissimulans]
MHQVTIASGGGGGGLAAQANKREGPRPRTKTAPSGASGEQRAGSVAVKKWGEGGNGLVGTVSHDSRALSHRLTCVSDFVSVSAFTTLFHLSIILMSFFSACPRMIITFTCASTSTSPP